MKTEDNRPKTILMPMLKTILMLKPEDNTNAYGDLHLREQIACFHGQIITFNTC